MLKYTKLILTMIFIVSAVIIPIYAQQEPCDKCKANPDSCKLIQTGKCDDCKDDEKTIEKKIIVIKQDEDRGFLGVVAEKTDKGLTIKKIVPDSPAEKAGLKSGDIILEVKTKPVKTTDELINVLKGTKPKDEVTIKIKSKGEDKSIRVILAEVPKSETQQIKIKVTGDDDEDIDIEIPMMGKEITCPKCGEKIPMPPCCPMMGNDKCKMMLMGKEPMMKMEKMQVMGKCPECGMKDMEMETCPHCNKKMEPCMPDMPEMPMMKEMQKEFMVMPPQETRGFLGVVTAEDDGKLVIQSIIPNSPAEKVGLKEEDVITEVNGTAVSAPSGLIDVLKGTRPGDMAHFKIISGGIEKLVDVELGEVPATQTKKMKIMIGGRKAEKGAGAGYFGPGFMSFDYSALNTIFTNHHLLLLDKNQFVFGGGGWGQGDRIRLGGFCIGGSQTVSNDTLSVEVGYGAGFFEMGYNIVNTKHFMLTPLIGIGGGGLTLKITSLLYNPTNLDDVLNQPGGISTVTTGGFTMFPGLSVDIPISFAGLSIKGGYMWTPMKGAWMVENFGKINGPGFDLKGPFVTLNIMFGGGAHKYK